MSQVLQVHEYRAALLKWDTDHALQLFLSHFFTLTLTQSEDFHNL